MVRKKQLFGLVLLAAAIASAPLSRAADLQILRSRANAPSLDGAGDWINTAGPLDLKDLRGKFVILDFWTYCCSNCMHILPELKKLEHAYPNNVVVIGVHSAKFQTERETENIREAVLRYEIEHPVLNDGGLVLWRKYKVSMWPTLFVIDPAGKVIAKHEGEIEFPELDSFLKRLVTNYRRQGVLDETPLTFNIEKLRATETPLRFPGKILADEDGNRLFIADSNHNRIVVTDLEGQLLEIIGNGAIGHDNGGYDEATFDHPQGLALHREQLFVADTENHVIRKVDLRTTEVMTVAGTGRKADVQIRTGSRDLNSPWDLWIVGEQLYIAMAGCHRIWDMKVDARRALPFAGNGIEDVIDGPLLPAKPYTKGFSSFAQPSGLASDGEKWLFVADSEGSSIRAVPVNGGAKVLTVMGTSKQLTNRLFTFGDRDGPASRALLQHPIGLTFYNRKLYVTDTYNNKIKEVDLIDLTIKTIGGDGDPGNSDSPSRFDEPAGVSAANGKLYVADTNNHAIRVIDLENEYRTSTLQIAGLSAPKVELPKIAGESRGKELPFAATTLRADDGELKIDVELTLPIEFKLNTKAPFRYVIESEGDSLIASEALGKSKIVETDGDRIEISVPLRAENGKCRARLSLTFFYCREGAEGVCRAERVNWLGEITLSADATKDRLLLKHEVR